MPSPNGAPVPSDLLSLSSTGKFGSYLEVLLAPVRGNLGGFLSYTRDLVSSPSVLVVRWQERRGLGK
jgi:hypothetical protein